MFFQQSQKSIIYPTIAINGVDIEKVDNFNFLGLIINMSTILLVKYHVL